MSHYRSACTGKQLTLWRAGVPSHGAMQQLSRQAQDTVELWKTYNKSQKKIREVEAKYLAAVHQRFIAGVNVTTTDVRKFLYSCTGLFTQTVDIDLVVSLNYTIPRGSKISPLSLYDMGTVNVLGNAATIDKYKDTLMKVLFSVRYQRGENTAHQEQLKKTARKSIAAFDWYLVLKETDDQPL